jgi:hypothetical protein
VATDTPSTGVASWSQRGVVPVDQSQRCVVLFDGESRGDGATVTGPRDRFVAPPGDYMLFVLGTVDVGSDAVLVPSVARMVKVAERADRYAST